MRKYLPFIALVAAALLFVWIKTHQRGGNQTISIEEKYPISGAEKIVSDTNSFDRKVERLSFSRHSRCRMDCRHIDESEVREILKDGVINYSKVEENERGKTYPLEGITHDKQHIRVVFAPHEKNELVVVTVIDLDKDWQCDCN